jgi:hypothetical protein
VHRFLYIFILLSVLFLGCTETVNSSKNATTNPKNSKNIDTLSQRKEINRIVEKYGVQWDFCDCVKKNDSIDKLLKNQKLTESELDVVLLRADEIEKKCKLLLTDLKSNKPSERQRHQEKVKACLEK